MFVGATQGPATQPPSACQAGKMCHVVGHQLVLLKIVGWIVESAASGMGRRGLYELLPQV
jgi:hypothetical protein